MKYLRNSILKYLLVVLFVSYYVGGIAFTHVHHYPTYSIIHSHPYLPGADGQTHHSHSTDALSTIEVLSHVVLDMLPVFALCMTWMLLFVLFPQPAYLTLLRLARYCSLRAPPAFI